MPKFRVTSPDGATYEVNAPDGATEEQAIEYVKQNHAPAEKPAPTMSYGAIPGVETTDRGAPAAQQPASPYLAPGPYTQRAPDGRLITRPPTPQESKPMDWGGAINSGAAGALDMATFGQGRKLFAKLESATGNGDYESNLAKNNRDFDKAESENPGAYAVGGAAGAYLNPVNRLVGQGADKILPATGTGIPGALARYGNRMGQGGVIGSMYGAGFAPEGKRTEGALKGFAGGALTAGALQGASDVGGALASRWARPAQLPPAQSEQQLYERMKAGYVASEKAGAVVTPDAFKQFVDDLPSKLKNFRERLAPETAALLEELRADAAKGVARSFADLDELRQLAAETAKGAKPNDIRLISDIKDHLDDFMENIKPQQLVGGDAAAASASLNEARSSARAYYKMRNINDIVETGENLNDQNWVKNQFRSIVRNPKKFGQYTNEEQKIISEIARTGNLEKAAKLLPWRGLQMATTYAEPLRQDAKIGSLQGLIARGGKSPTGAIFGGVPTPTFLSPYAGLLGSQLLSPDRATPRK